MTQINTSAFCFFCLKPTKIKTEPDEWDGNDEINLDNESNESKPKVSLLCLRRHLNINVTGIPGTCEAESFKESEVNVSLCDDCEKAVSKFSGLFQELEKVRIEMDYYLEKIGFYIKKGLENSERVQAYSKRMTSKADTLSQLAWIDKLRKEICNKCSTVRSASRPTVKIHKMKINSIRPFVKEEEISEEESNDEGHSPPASPPASHCELNFIKNENTEETAQREFKMDKITKRIHCPSCDQTFTKKPIAKIHFNVVHLKQKWKCDFCNKEIRAYPVGIRHHKKTCRVSHPKTVQPKAREHYKFPCDVCKMKFPNQKHLKNHKWRIHDTSRPYVCNLCGKGFKYDCDLKWHNEVAHLGRRWRCKCCKKPFNKSSNCTLHEKKCLIKNKIKVEPKIASKLKFSRDLTGRVTCPDCSKTFAEFDTVRLHYNNVHLNKRLKCELCNIATFAYPPGLAKHKKICPGNT